MGLVRPHNIQRYAAILVFPTDTLSIAQVVLRDDCSLASGWGFWLGAPPSRKVGLMP